LEYWNNGFWNTGKAGLMSMLVLKIKVKWITSYKNQYSSIPLFHYSRIEAKTQTSKVTL
jgi:hypothetical protein